MKKYWKLSRKREAVQIETVRIVLPYRLSVGSKDNKMEFLVGFIFSPVMRNEAKWWSFPIK